MEFIEKQRFDQWWLWLFLIIMQTTTVVLYFTGVFDQSDDPVPGVIAMLLPVIPITLFLLFRLDTTVNKLGVRAKFFPFVNRFHSWEEIDTFEVIKYGFVGGWGIRLWTAYGTVYNVRGNRGLYIKLKSGKQFLIGTQKHKELVDFLKSLRKK